jgi:hypothetical protein
MVTGIQIIAEKGILFGAWLCFVLAADQIAIMVPDPAHTPVHLKFAGQDTHRNAGATKLAGWTIGNVLRATETALRKQVIDFAGLVTHKMSEDLPFHLAVEIRAGRWSR